MWRKAHTKICARFGNFFVCLLLLSADIVTTGELRKRKFLFHILLSGIWTVNAYYSKCFSSPALVHMRHHNNNNNEYIYINWITSNKN